MNPRIRNTSLTVEQVVLLRALVKAGANQTTLAKEWGISRVALSRIVKKHTWKDV